MSNNQSPGGNQSSQNPNSQGTSAPGSKDQNKGQAEQSGRQGQQGGAQRPDKPHDSDPGKTMDKESNRSGTQR